MRDADAADRRALARAIQDLRAKIRAHPSWAAEKISAQRALARLERRLSDVKARKDPEEWAQLLSSSLPSGPERFPEMLGGLPPFDEAARCPKCGKNRARTRWVPDRLERTCRRCGYRWLEAPLAAMEESPERERDPHPEG